MRVEELKKNGRKKPSTYPVRFVVGILVEAAAISVLAGIALFISILGF